MNEDKRMAGDYEIIHAIKIGDREIVIGENQADENGQKYMTAIGEWNDLFERYGDVLDVYKRQGLFNTMSREMVLKNCLDAVKKNYDYVLIDCMPSLGMMTINSPVSYTHLDVYKRQVY